MCRAEKDLSERSMANTCFNFSELNGLCLKKYSIGKSVARQRCYDRMDFFFYNRKQLTEIYDSLNFFCYGFEKQDILWV